MDKWLWYSIGCQSNRSDLVAASRELAVRPKCPLIRPPIGLSGRSAGCAPIPPQSWDRVVIRIGAAAERCTCLFYNKRVVPMVVNYAMGLGRSAFRVLRYCSFAESVISLLSSGR